jgi:O-antigen ligase
VGYAFVVNLRPVVFLVLAWIAAEKCGWLKEYWRRLVLVPAAAVVMFGLAQITFLPADFLRHFGYGPDTLQPYQTVDQKMAFVRIQSTLRGANPLGAYLMMILCAYVALAFKSRKKIFCAISTTFVLYFTYSRSAYIGVLVSLLALAVKSRKVWRYLVVGALAAALVVGGATAVFKNNSRFQNTFFHTSNSSASSDNSNAKRWQAQKDGIRDVIREPLGRGPGTAGPASVYNAPHEVRLAENYYLQIGQEVGWLGLGIFVAINVALAKALWRRRQDTLAKVLLASGVGITVICLLSHALTDDTLSYLWFGLAGIILAKGENEKTES